MLLIKCNFSVLERRGRLLYSACLPVLAAGVLGCFDSVSDTFFKHVPT